MSVFSESIVIPVLKPIQTGRHYKWNCDPDLNINGATCILDCPFADDDKLEERYENLLYLLGYLKSM